MIQGSGSIPMTTRSGSGRYKNMWIRIRIPNTVCEVYRTWRWRGTACRAWVCRGWAPPPPPSPPYLVRVYLTVAWNRLPCLRMSRVSATSTLSLFSWMRSRARSRFSQNEISYACAGDSYMFHSIRKSFQRRAGQRLGGSRWFAGSGWADPDEFKI